MEKALIEFINSQLSGNFIIISIVLYGIGIAIRSSKRISSDLIPTCLMVIGSLLTLIFMTAETTKDSLPNSITLWLIFLITAVSKGIISAICSSGIYSCLKNYGITIGKRGYNKQDEDIDIKTKRQAELESEIDIPVEMNPIRINEIFNSDNEIKFQEENIDNTDFEGIMGNSYKS